MGRARRLAARVKSETGLTELQVLERRLEVVEEAMAENTALGIPLAARVGELERLLVGPLEHRSRATTDDPT